MRSRFLQLVGAALMFGSLASVLLMPSCGVMSSGQCADKAACMEDDTGAGPSSPDVVMDTSDPGTGDARPAADAPGERSDAAETSSLDVASADGDHDVVGAGDVKDVRASDSALEDVTSETGPDTSLDASFDVYGDVPSDAIFMGDTAACGPCTNACIPSFVQCCTPSNTCGCIELFFPVLCQ